MKKYLTLRQVGTLSFPLLLGLIVGVVLKEDFSYIESLPRTIKVPSIVFPIVWTILYILMGIYKELYDEDETKDKNLEVPYYLSLLFNVLFSFLLFAFHQKFLALLDLVILIALVGYLFVNGWRNKKKYSYLLIPHLLWLFVALSLMLDIVSH